MLKEAGQRHLAAGVIFALLVSWGTAVQAQVPNIQIGHPRLWLSSSTEIARAREWLAQSNQMPDEDDHAGNAFLAVVNGESGRCTAPVAWLVNFTLPDIGNVSSDHARWYGEQAALVFDWCYSAMSPSQRTTVIERWNGYLDILNAKPWGGPGLEANNYFWGYLRDDINWAIATWYENARADEFLEHGLDTRYRDWFVANYIPQFGSGGVPGEGTQYGRYMLSYPVVPFLSLRSYGVNAYAETNFFNEAVYYLAHSLVPGATPAPPNQPHCNAEYRYFMPFNDDEAFYLCEPEAARSSDYGMFLLAMSETAPGRVAEHARRLLKELAPRLPYWAQYRTPSGSERDYAETPLDYFAPGSGFLFGRSSWGDGKTSILLQLASPGGVGHVHQDTGSFQMWSGGNWASRETTSYTDLLAGYAGGPAIDGGSAIGHNGLLLEGKGERNWESGGPRNIPVGSRRGSNPDGLAKVKRLQHTKDFLYAVTDISLPFRSAQSGDPCRYDWPFAEHVEREFVFIRSLDALVVFDRVESGSDSLDYDSTYCRTVGFSDYTGPRLAAADVRKTFLAHFLGPVTRTGNVATSTLGDRTVRLHTLFPASPVVRVIDERNGNPASVGQYRVEVETSGQAQSYLLNVIESAPTGGVPLTASFNSDATPWRLSLSRGSSTVVEIEIKPGRESIGGAVIIGSKRVALSETVQETGVNQFGPFWKEPRSRKNDFDGDGASDLLWRNASTGVNAVWRSANHATQLPVSTVTNLSWKVAGTGDFDADGKADILWRNHATGMNAVWRSGNDATQLPIASVANLAWEIAGTGDFDADGYSDVLWRNNATGVNAIWRSANHSTQLPITSVTNLAWRIVGAGDFDGDGKSDILWRNNETGTNALWRSGNHATQLPIATVTNLAWKVEATGDLDADGKSDIVWRNHSTGVNAVWRSANHATQQPIAFVSNLDWLISGIGDFDADGKSDLVWRNAVTGANAVWRSGNHATQSPIMAVANLSWEIMDTRP